MMRDGVECRASGGEQGDGQQDGAGSGGAQSGTFDHASSLAALDVPVVGPQSDPPTPHG
jgi:hypothetical protein